MIYRISYHVIASTVDLFLQLIHSSKLTTALIGIGILSRTSNLRGMCALLLFIILATLFNLLEELNITRHVYLVSPIFVLGYGPALYLAVKRLTHGPIKLIESLHLAPMLLLLPFTEFTQIVIGIGSGWRLIYAIMTLHLLYQYKISNEQNRSDYNELSLTWLSFLIVSITVTNFVDLVRLNFQPELGDELNTLGYSATSFITLCALILLVITLNHMQPFLSALNHQTNTPIIHNRKSSLSPPNNMSHEDKAIYTQIFDALDKSVKTNEWYRRPSLTLTELASLTNFSTRDISRAINLIAEKNFNDYINSLRVDYVVLQLNNKSQATLLELALHAGFKTKSTFNKSFKLFQGVTPSQYRNITRK